ncbi:hypothetical protein GOP47_0027260 [Adiantum capillus-veneris]|nr:hypothetical protein GOP47_0027260 [Adiantum capillus-veneris]
MAIRDSVKAHEEEEPIPNESCTPAATSVRHGQIYLRKGPPFLLVSVSLLITIVIIIVAIARVFLLFLSLHLPPLLVLSCFSLKIWSNFEADLFLSQARQEALLGNC